MVSQPPVERRHDQSALVVKRMPGHDTREQVTIGIVGGGELVRRLMAVARTTASPSWRLVAAAYDAEDDAPTHAARLAPRIDVCLFGGPLPYDLSVGSEDLPIPATYVPIGGSSLYAALLRAQLSNSMTLERITIDSVAEDDVRSAYQEAGLDSGRVLIEPYRSPESAESFVRFHQENYQQGHSTGAITTVVGVATALRTANIPTLFMRATPATLANALQTAALIGSGAQLEESRIVTLVVRIPPGMLPDHASRSSYWYEDLKLAVQRELLREARPMDAVVLPHGGDGYLVITTMGSLTTATNGLTIAPFLGRVNAELKLDVEVGIGLGRSAREAELNAEAAVDKVSAAGGAVAYLVGPGGTVLGLPRVVDQGADQRADPRAAGAPAAVRDARAVEALTALNAKLRAEGDADRLVDAGAVAELLDVTSRTARRTLQLLVDAGLAWRMPPARSNASGRPAQLYQLLVENLQDSL